MPIVEITLFEGRDEETKGKIARAVADAVAEHTRNHMADVHVIFHDVPRTSWWRGLIRTGARKPTAAPVRSDYAWISRIQYDPAREAEYLAFRRDTINPTLAAQDGFVSALLLRPQNREHEYVLVLKWLSEQHARAFEKSEAHDRLRERALQLLPRALETTGAEVVHLDPQ